MPEVREAIRPRPEPGTVKKPSREPSLRGYFVPLTFFNDSSEGIACRCASASVRRYREMRIRQ
jgi:hypothetical protein